MSDAITELRRLRDAMTIGPIPFLREVVDHIDARIAELKAAARDTIADDPLERQRQLRAEWDREAQQAEPSDAEIDAWRNTADNLFAGDFSDEDCDFVLDRAVALMRRGRDAKLREAVSCFLLRMEQRHAQIVGIKWPSLPQKIDALRAALGES